MNGPFLWALFSEFLFAQPCAVLRKFEHSHFYGWQPGLRFPPFFSTMLVFQVSLYVQLSIFQLRLLSFYQQNFCSFSLTFHWESEREETGKDCICLQ